MNHKKNIFIDALTKKKSKLPRKHNKTDKIKSSMQKIDNSNLDSLKEMNLEVRPWGYFETIYERTGYKVKIISVKPKQQLSLQLHNKRAEHWIVVEGKADVTIGKKTLKLKKNQIKMMVMKDYKIIYI